MARAKRFFLIIFLGLLGVTQIAFSQNQFLGDNLMGLRGGLRTLSAQNNDPGYFSLGTNFQFFKASEFIRSGTDLLDHSRFYNSYSLAFAPFKYMEVGFALHVISDDTVGPTDGLQVAVGDPQLTIKGGFDISKDFAIGAMVDIRFPSSSGFLEASLDSSVITLAALATYRLPSIPLFFHLNAGFIIDGSENLLDIEEFKTYHLFAAQISSFHRIHGALSIEYFTDYVAPFLEFSTEPFVGGGNPGFGGSPTKLSVGVKGFIGEKKGLELLAGVDIGLTGVGPRDEGDVEAGKYAFTIPRWNIVFRASYRFDPFAKTEVIKEVQKPKDPTAAKKVEVKLAAITGSIVDESSGKAVDHAKIAVDESGALIAVDESGKFTSYKLPYGKHTLNVRAKGYRASSVEVALGEGGSSTAVKLTPVVDNRPGTIRGKVRSVRGRKVKNAIILIPELDKTIRVGRSGEFTINLKAGQYKLVVSARGYRTQRKTLKVVPGETLILNLEMHR